jgi:hypothetical protein
MREQGTITDNPVDYFARRTPVSKPMHQ